MIAGQAPIGLARCPEPCPELTTRVGDSTSSSAMRPSSRAAASSTATTLDLAIGVAFGLIYDGALLGGLLPEDGISWQDHFFGAVGGVVATRVLAASGDARLGGSPRALTVYPDRRDRHPVDPSREGPIRRSTGEARADRRARDRAPTEIRPGVETPSESVDPGLARSRTPRPAPRRAPACARYRRAAIGAEAPGPVSNSEWASRLRAPLRASTQRGSNWVPAWRVSSAMASPAERPLR